MNETNEIVAEKFLSVVSEDIKPILCIGETLKEREADDTKHVIQKQLTSVINYVGIDAFSKAIIAYEPIWAIGTGFSATPKQAQEVHHYIRSILTAESKEIADNLQILYGGSVNGGNASGLFSMQDIDGGLIGGASIDALEFASIIKAAILEK
jgi:triosephosphate isomerase